MSNQKTKKIAAIVAGVVLISAGAYPLVKRLMRTPTEIAQDAIATIVCETTILDAVAASNSILDHAKKNGKNMSLAEYTDEAKRLQKRLIEITQAVRTKDRELEPASGNIRRLASMEEKQQTLFVNDTCNKVQRACPKLATNRSYVTQAVKSVMVILKQ